ncbi:hypothetical protein [Rhizobium rhizogenes]|uniref:hypothetical protein n=1 Tax=Rhizobium rhizogenes TaxID=359 RepID=UPI001573E364|nr:hypothetical protein [Rhizobium rhizogenes]NTF64939.1 hypothetical protein [Rhizobium rhizogenes]NTG96287.1 hypothetical protein [Rhizobium rhizogenes]
MEDELPDRVPFTFCLPRMWLTRTVPNRPHRNQMLFDTYRRRAELSIQRTFGITDSRRLLAIQPHLIKVVPNPLFAHSPVVVEHIQFSVIGKKEMIIAAWHGLLKWGPWIVAYGPRPLPGQARANTYD